MDKKSTKAKHLPRESSGRFVAVAGAAQMRPKTVVTEATARPRPGSARKQVAAELRTASEALARAAAMIERQPNEDDYPLDEQEADWAAIDEANRRLASGEDWILPKAVSDAMLDDDDPAHPVKAWRRYRGLTIAELGKKAGVSPQTVNMIERGHREGRGSTLAKLAAVLDCRLEDLVE